ncbi:long-chain-fatty-acid--CoA ligase [Streptomyces olivaceoviridis]|uniref:class I adenylate-forming enzyme family protein n=1 Tax=Streptomyces olivaceoviridis TaxID=1921 RepID=UPI00167496E2|nr:class I adenylate-forming enzyme family protein [Streptomyces olivaceoviridis]GGZ09260.1 long-chain-fatty-acid--CoA ligase [Streptomyces olivaceoviridis]
MTDAPTAVSELYTALCRHRDAAPDAVALRTATANGRHRTFTRAEFCADVLSVAAGGRITADRSPVVVRVDGSAESIVTVVGLALTGADLLLIEEESSYLADPGSALRRLAPSTVVGPPATAPDAPDPNTYLTYEECRGEFRRPAAGRDGEILQMTSGSTGEPRVVRQPLRHVLRGARTYGDVLRLGPGDTLLTAVPAAHSFGLVGGLMAALVSGAGLWALPRFGLRPLLDGLDAGATVLLGTPLVYELLTRVLRTRNRPPALRVALSSGGPLAPAVAAEAASGLGVPVRQIYGSTETGLIAVQPGHAEAWPANAVGVAAPGVGLRVEPPGGEGELLVRTPTLLSGYAAEPGGPPLTEDGFYRTGDVARIDAEGRVFLIGRKSTFVNVGGRKVNPRRIERILAEHPAVREVHVHGVAAPGAEEHMEAVVVPDPGTTVADLARFCRTRGLLPYEVPHRFHVVDRLPRTSMGKVDRRRVRAATAGTATDGATSPTTSVPAAQGRTTEPSGSEDKDHE